MLPSCGVLWGCRTKHQKLKTGNDQSPGDKKPETEADQRMFNQALIYYYVTAALFSEQLKVSAFLFFCCCITIGQSIFCSSQWAGWVRLWASQSDVLEGGSSATTQVRPLRHQLVFLFFFYLSQYHTNVFHQYFNMRSTLQRLVYMGVSKCLCVLFPMNVDILRKWVIQTLSWICGLSVCARCSGGAAPRLTGLRPVKPVLSLSPGQVESRCWSDR